MPAHASRPKLVGEAVQLNAHGLFWPIFLGRKNRRPALSRACWSQMTAITGPIYRYLNKPYTKGKQKMFRSELSYNWITIRYKGLLLVAYLSLLFLTMSMSCHL